MCTLHFCVAGFQRVRSGRPPNERLKSFENISQMWLRSSPPIHTARVCVCTCVCVCVCVCTCVCVCMWDGTLASSMVGNSSQFIPTQTQLQWFCHVVSTVELISWNSHGRDREREGVNKINRLERTETNFFTSDVASFIHWSLSSTNSFLFL